MEVCKLREGFVVVHPDSVVSVIKWADLMVASSGSMNLARDFLSKVATLC